MRIEKYFCIKERNTSVKTEFIAGITSFFAICYILIVNGRMFSEIPGLSFGAIYIATGITTILGTLLIGIYSNLPLIVSTALGVNAFFVYTACLSLGFTYENALMIVFIDGLLFVILSITGLRKIFFDSLPKCVTLAISVGIGLFIAFVGFQSSSIITFDNSTCVKLNCFSFLEGGEHNLIICLLTLISLVLLLTFKRKNIQIGIFITLIIGTILYYILHFIFPNIIKIEAQDFNIIDGFKDFWNMSCFACFRGFDFSHYLSIEGHNIRTLVISLISLFWTFSILSMFDTVGSIMSCVRVAGLDKGNLVNKSVQKAVIADAFSTCFAGLFGTSNQTVFVESSAGIGVGGRTGLTSIFAACGFLIALFFLPIAQMVPPAVYSSILIFVGLFMAMDIKDLNWSDPIEAFVSFITIVVMPFTYNVSYGIGFGLITYVLLKISTGKIKELNTITWLVFILFLGLIFGIR